MITRRNMFKAAPAVTLGAAALVLGTPTKASDRRYIGRLWSDIDLYVAPRSIATLRGGEPTDVGFSMLTSLRNEAAHRSHHNLVEGGIVSIDITEAQENQLRIELRKCAAVLEQAP